MRINYQLAWRCNWWCSTMLFKTAENNNLHEIQQHLDTKSQQVESSSLIALRKTRHCHHGGKTSNTNNPHDCLGSQSYLCPQSLFLTLYFNIYADLSPVNTYFCMLHELQQLWYFICCAGAATFLSLPIHGLLSTSECSLRSAK